MEQSDVKAGSSNNQIFAGYAMLFKSIQIGADIKSPGIFAVNGNGIPIPDN